MTCYNRSEKDIFVSYDKSSSVYIMCFPESKDIRNVRYIKFSNSFKIENNDSKPTKPELSKLFLLAAHLHFYILKLS